MAETRPTRQETVFYDFDDDNVNDNDQQTSEEEREESPLSYVDEKKVKAVAAVVLEAIAAVTFPPRAGNLEEQVDTHMLNASRAAVSAVSHAIRNSTEEGRHSYETKLRPPLSLRGSRKLPHSC